MLSSIQLSYKNNVISLAQNIRYYSVFGTFFIFGRIPNIHIPYGRIPVSERRLATQRKYIVIVLGRLATNSVFVKIPNTEYSARF